tara:strand:- start:828 stop:1115 length:288 start_codon:yes stop_codon:yes gene_type:complete
MKKFILCFLAVVFPFLVFFIIDLPGAGLVALGLQSTILGWPVAVVWALKHVIRITDGDKLKHAATMAAAAAMAAAKAAAAAQAEINAAEKAQRQK